MNSTVTRGRGEMVVAATGMTTEVGQISRMLGQVEQEKTPLTRQLDELTVVITTWRRSRLRWWSFRADPRRVIRRSVPGRDQPGDRGDPDGAPGGRHDRTLARDASSGGEGRDREAVAVGGDPRLDLGDLFGQDGDVDAQPDDGAPAGRRGTALQRRGGGVLDERQDLPRCGRDRRSLEPYLLPMALANDAAVREGEIVGDPTEAALSSSRRREVSTSTRRGACTRVSERCRSTPSTS